MSMSYSSPEDMPPGLRRLYEAQVGQRERAAEAGARLAALPQETDTVRRKYGNSPTSRTLENGSVINFDSKKEAAYFDTLLALRAAGQVNDIRLQVQFLLKAAYTDADTGERMRAISYLADFTYWQKDADGEWKYHIVDVKGRRTKDYALKRKIMADMGHRIEEV